MPAEDLKEHSVENDIEDNAAPNRGPQRRRRYNNRSFQDVHNDEINESKYTLNSVWNTICDYKWSIGIASVVAATAILLYTKPDMIFKNSVIAQMSEKLFGTATELSR